MVVSILSQLVGWKEDWEIVSGRKSFWKETQGEPSVHLYGCHVKLVPTSGSTSLGAQDER